MSAAVDLTPPNAPPPPRRPRPRGRRWTRLVAVAAVSAAVLAAAGWGLWRLLRSLEGPGAAVAVPTAEVKQGTVRMQVYANGALKGGRAEMLTAPPVAGGPLSIKFLRAEGELVHAGEEVVAFDTSTQEYNLTQAQEALQQAQQQVAQAQATARAQAAANAYQLQKAGFDVQRAELQVRRNPLLASVDAQKNTLALAAARDHLQQLQQDASSQEQDSAASIAVQQTAERKAQADAATAEHNIASMTLRAQQDGYVSIQDNLSAGILYVGMVLPPFQAGDTARSGQSVAEIPDLTGWEVDVDVSELDAGHLAVGEPARIQLVAFPGQNFAGAVESIGATSGRPWARQTAVVLSLLHPTPALRPGLSATAIITTGTVTQALWAPSQAVFDNGGASFVYQRVKGGFQSGFQRRPVTVVERGESQVVVRGVPAGAVIALANPEAQPTAAGAAAGRGSAGAAGALPGGQR
ncbi:MAG TPA: efflux RND transporter periplasmic adaptor subunit [Terriglobales bacterium]|jgi:multidrug resistance efflux pump